MNASVNKELLTILLGTGAMLDATDNELSCEKITNKVIAQRQRVFVNSNEKLDSCSKIRLKSLQKGVIMIIQRKHPLQSGCPKFNRFIVLADTAYPVGQTG